ncbi:MAG: putative DNA binding domain-containing protein [Candidatus Methanoplasma sp.]|jgi:ATP-dependent DNA helicase RecG|nr:putative DNA binding domain-containing protein [Candidatus Methanoplasma sp.]
MEDQNNEWKLIWDKEYLKVIASFANADGGILTIGIDDDGKVVGINDVKELLKTLPDLIHNNLGIIPSIRYDIEGDKGMISIAVNPSQDPVFYNGKAYVRSGSTTRELSGIELRSFIQRDGGMSWSDSPAQSINVSDIENYAFDEFKKRARTYGRLTDSEIDLPAKDLLEKLGLMSKGVPTRAAAILFLSCADKSISSSPHQDRQTQKRRIAVL